MPRLLFKPIRLLSLLIKQLLQLRITIPQQLDAFLLATIRYWGLPDHVIVIYVDEVFLRFDRSLLQVRIHWLTMLWKIYGIRSTLRRSEVELLLVTAPVPRLHAWRHAGGKPAGGFWDQFGRGHAPATAATLCFYDVGGVAFVNLFEGFSWVRWFAIEPIRGIMDAWDRAQQLFIASLVEVHFISEISNFCADRPYHLHLRTGLVFFQMFWLF